MEFADYPLLNTPNLIVVLLRTAADGSATIDDAVARLRDGLRRAREDPPFDDETLRKRLRSVCAYLADAGMMQLESGDGFVITDRGLRAIADCPAGFDTADLVRDAEIRRRLRDTRRREVPSDPRNDRYADGYNAWRSGRRITENPYLQDSIDHLAWEDGWCEGMDSQQQRPADSSRR